MCYVRNTSWKIFRFFIKPIYWLSEYWTVFRIQTPFDFNNKKSISYWMSSCPFSTDHDSKSVDFLRILWHFYPPPYDHPAKVKSHFCGHKGHSVFTFICWFDKLGILVLFRCESNFNRIFLFHLNKKLSILVY